MWVLLKENCLDSKLKLVNNSGKYLAKIMEVNGEIEKAIALFNLLRTEYREAYDPWGELGLDSPAISACESLINIYTQQNRPEAEIEALE